MSTTNEMYYGNVVIGADTKDVYQNIYASQAYGTFFGIHGKIFRNQNNKVDSIKLILANYKGHYNLLIRTATLSLGSHLNENCLVLKISIQAPISNFRPSDFEVDIEKNASGINLSNVKFFKVERELVSLSGHTYNELQKMDCKLHRPIENGVFDHEFFFRNGSLIALRQIGDFNIDKESSDNSKISPRDGNLICRQRLSQLFVL